MQSNLEGWECLWGVYPIGDLFASEVAQQIKDEQDDEHKAESAAAADMSSVSIAAATEEKNKDNNQEDEHHNDILDFFGCYFFAAGDGWVASFSVDTDEGVVTVSVGFGGECVGSKPGRRASM